MRGALPRAARAVPSAMPAYRACSEAVQQAVDAAFAQYVDGAGLTAEQAHVLELLIAGVSGADVPSRLGSTPARVEALERAICRKTGRESVHVAAADVLRLVACGSTTVPSPERRRSARADESDRPELTRADLDADLASLKRKVREKTGHGTLDELILDIWRTAVLEGGQTMAEPYGPPGAFARLKERVAPRARMARSRSAAARRTGRRRGR
jgi:hypothetical protein